MKNIFIECRIYNDRDIGFNLPYSGHNNTILINGSIRVKNIKIDIFTDVKFIPVKTMNNGLAGYTNMSIGWINLSGSIDDDSYSKIAEAAEDENMSIQIPVNGKSYIIEFKFLLSANDEKLHLDGSGKFNPLV